MAQIDHVFVLMLENRSFDHFFGLSGRPGIPRPTDPGFGPGAKDQSAADPPHEFPDVQSQVMGGTMGGFPAASKLAFTPDQIPVITELANQFLLFDNWYSSLPGPTWPNRFFVHAASSGGLAASPRVIDTFTGVTLPAAAFQFENGTIYQRLTAAGKKWRVYHGDIHPQVMALDGMVAKSFDRQFFRPVYPDATNPAASDFATDVAAAGYDIDYTFIEPNYAIEIAAQFVHGDSQHPRGFVSAGETFIRFVYDAVRNSPVWGRSALLVLWDEHGGFYDHASPPVAVPPGDKPFNAKRAGSGAPTFGFDVLGVRVPALLVSPWVPKGALGSQVFPGAHFDHASVVSSLRKQFGLGGPLTQRDASSPDWLGGLLATARPSTDAGPAKLAAPAPALAGPMEAGLATRKTIPTKKDDAFIEGIALISVDLDRYVSAKDPTRAPIARPHGRPAANVGLAAPAAEAGIDSEAELLAYIRQVDAKVRTHKSTTP